MTEIPPKDDALVDQPLARPESLTFECKRIGKVDRLLESVVAFANTEGGILALGLEDPDKASGRERVYGIQSHPMNWDELQRKLRSRITEPDRLSVAHREIGCTLRDGSHGSMILLKVERSGRVHSIVDDIRIFSNRIEVESPGLLPGRVTIANIQTERHNRNPLIVQHLREFPDPPNLDAHEGVKMMFGPMQEAGLYPPMYLTRPRLKQEAVLMTLWNQNQPGAWEQVSQYIDQHRSIANTDVRRILGIDDSLRATRKLREWVDQGLLIVANPKAGKKFRRYTKPHLPPEDALISHRGRMPLDLDFVLFFAMTRLIAGF